MFFSMYFEYTPIDWVRLTEIGKYKTMTSTRWLKLFQLLLFYAQKKTYCVYRAFKSKLNYCYHLDGDEKFMWGK